jgi:PAT family beta-lactamase induction signal transducer AmpG|tara:strand:+ start:11085 stop:12287 length:1203 start_codon:yes stop_codon:yes gene_type:complete
MIKDYLNKEVLISFLMGFSAGVPLLMTISILQAWMKESGIDLSTIGLFGLVGIPYSLKFLWAPFLDRFSLPFLGRRRGWLLVSQILIIVTILGISYIDITSQLTGLVMLCLGLTFLSATQDILIDAYRRENVSEKHLPLASSVYIIGYRVAMAVVGSVGFILSDSISFNLVYLCLSGLMVVGIITTLISDEGDFIIKSRESIIEPFIDYFRKNKALIILAFIFIYKIGDMLAFFMSVPYYLDLEYTKSQIGYMKFIGTWMTLLGSFVGGILLVKYNNIMKGLFYFGILQMVSTFGYVILSWVEPNLILLCSVGSFESFCSGLGTAVFISYIALLTNIKFTGTQYALLSSFVAIPRTIFTSQTGFLVESIGWEYFFIFCTLIAIPGLILIKFIDRGDKANG